MWDSYGTCDLNPPLPHTSLAPMIVTRGTQAPKQTTENGHHTTVNRESKMSIEEGRCED